MSNSEKWSWAVKRFSSANLWTQATSSRRCTLLPLRWQRSSGATTQVGRLVMFSPVFSSSATICTLEVLEQVHWHARTTAIFLKDQAVFLINKCVYFFAFLLFKVSDLFVWFSYMGFYLLLLLYICVMVRPWMVSVFSLCVLHPRISNSFRVILNMEKWVVHFISVDTFLRIVLF